jgi:hypothetical protein
MLCAENAGKVLSAMRCVDLRRSGAPDANPSFCLSKAELKAVQRAMPDTSGNAKAAAILGKHALQEPSFAAIAASIFFTARESHCRAASAARSLIAQPQPLPQGVNSARKAACWLRVDGQQNRALNAG